MPSVLLAIIFILGTALIALSVYFAARWIVGDRFDDQTETLAGSVIFRVSALHGLILALVFAQELVAYNQLQTNLVREATAVADIYYDMERYGSDQVDIVLSALSGYVQVVIDKEWQSLAQEKKLSAEGWALRETVYLTVLDLVPETPRQDALRNHMLAKVQLVAEMRQERETNAMQNINALFWIAALAGIILVTLPYFIFSPTRLHLALLSVYGGFTGLIMFIIFAFSDPFAAPGALEPVAFERLLESSIASGT